MKESNTIAVCLRCGMKYHNHDGLNCPECGGMLHFCDVDMAETIQKKVWQRSQEKELDE